MRRRWRTTAGTGECAEYLKMKNVFKIENRGGDHVHGPILYGEVFAFVLVIIYKVSLDKFCSFFTGFKVEKNGNGQKCN